MTARRAGTKQASAETIRTPEAVAAKAIGSADALSIREHFSVAQANAPKGAKIPDTTSVVYGDWKLIHTARAGESPQRWLFDLKVDPGEHRDVADARPIVAGTLDQMRRWMRRDHDARQPRPEDFVDSSTLDSEVKKNLRALGYIE